MGKLIFIHCNISFGLQYTWYYIKLVLYNTVNILLVTPLVVDHGVPEFISKMLIIKGKFWIGFREVGLNRTILFLKTPLSNNI